MPMCIGMAVGDLILSRLRTCWAHPSPSATGSEARYITCPRYGLFCGKLDAWLAVGGLDSAPTLGGRYPWPRCCISSIALAPPARRGYARAASEMLLLLVSVRPSYSVDDLVQTHRDYLRGVRSEGEQAVHRHLEHSTRQIQPRSTAVGDVHR
jgi:hypothetical protein